LPGTRGGEVFHRLWRGGVHLAKTGAAPNLCYDLNLTRK
jgi:hypothetical protein